MAIEVTNSGQGRNVEMASTERRFGKLTITGLSEGANTVPHGLPFTPSRLSFRPGAGGLWGETSAPTGTNIYITVGSGGATAGVVDYWE